MDKYTVKLRNRRDWTDALQPECNDVEFDAAGRLRMITGEEKCAQELDTTLLEPARPGHHFGYTGCGLWSIIGKDLALHELLPMGEILVRDAINRLHARQKGARRRPEEIIDKNPRTLHIAAGQSYVDSTNVILVVRARTLAGTQIIGVTPLADRG